MMNLKILIISISFGAVFTACSKKTSEKIVGVPLITSVDTTVIRVGDTITVLGSGFAAKAADNIVSIGSFPLKVISSTSDRLKAVVRSGTQTGQLTVSFSGGRAATYSRLIQVIVSGQPVIFSVSPSFQVEPGDTLTIKGVNFSVPARNNAVKINGSTATIISALDTVIVVEAPASSSTGNLEVTASNLTSLGYPITVSKPNLLEDGRLYWFYTGTSSFRLLKGNDVNEGTNPIIPLTPVLTIPDFKVSSGPDFTLTLTLSTVINNYQAGNSVVDEVGNFYYVRTASSGMQYTMSLICLNFGSPLPVKRTLWTSPTYSRADYNTGIPPTSLVALNGTQIYVQARLGLDFYVGDISLANPVFNRIQLANEDVSRTIAFSKNKLVYARETNLNLTNNFSFTNRAGGIVMASKDGSSSLIYTLPGGGSGSTNTDTWGVKAIFASPSHGDSVLIYAVRNAVELGGKPTAAFFLYDPFKDQMSVLYDRTNWIDADGAPASPNLPVADLNGGILWAGSHIYYANRRRNAQSSQLLRLNANGSSKKPLIIYSRLESNNSDPKSVANFQLLIDPTQRK